MIDARDDLAEAVARTKRLAASRVIRKEELEAELARWKGERARLAALGEGPEAQALLGELSARIETVARELAVTEGELRDALAELAELHELAGSARADAARAVVASATGDPVLRSPEEIALENARAHLAELEAQARLGDELAEKASHDQAPREKAPSTEEADAQALAEFQALRSKPKKTL